MLKRALIAAVLVVAAADVLAQAPPASAGTTESWPARTVHLVVPSPGGSGIDAVARMLAQRLALQWGQPVVVENRPGANSIIGTEAVARAAPDAYTLLFASDSAFTVNPHLYANLPYDPVRDFVPITQVVTFYQLLVAHPSLGAETMAEFVSLARAAPGRFTYASFGSGSAAHLLSELLENQARVELLHVPYKGIAQAVAAVLAGESMLTWAGIFSTQAHVKTGRLKALGIAAPKRSTFLPEVPTLAELGYPAIEYTLWFGLFAPAATPRPLVDRIHRDVARILADPDVRDKELLSKSYEPSGITPHQFADHIRRESIARAALVKLSGAKVE
jgi:tripartite-type tricarboxylate transporter receptor subunit TctC